MRFACKRPLVGIVYTLWKPVAGLIIIVSVLGWLVRTGEAQIQQESNVQSLKQLLPPDVFDTNNIPQVVGKASQIGGDWFFAICSKGQWGTIIYYPLHVNLKSIKMSPIETDTLKNRDLVWYEVVASVKQAGGTNEITSVFRSWPMQDKRPLFIPVDGKGMLVLDTAYYKLPKF